MEETRLLRASSRTELLDVAGAIVTMLLSSVCVVLICAAANQATQTAAKVVVYTAPAASAPNGSASVGVASAEPR